MQRVFSATLLSLILAVILMAGTATGVEAAQQAGMTTITVKLVNGLNAVEQAAVIARNGGTETQSKVKCPKADANALGANYHSAVIACNGMSKKSELRLFSIVVPELDLPLILQNYRKDPQVESVEVSMQRKAEGLSNDQNIGVQWALTKIGWDSVFNTVIPKGNAKVAILDTGVDSTHPDLNKNVISGVSIIDGTNGLTDPSGHGTKLAGIVAAVTDNNRGIAGVAFNGVKILPVTVLDHDGLGWDDDIISGIIWATDNGADVILMGFSNAQFSQHLQDAIDYAWSKGVVLVAATGNSGVGTSTFPAGDRGVIGVSATDQNDRLAYFSNYGQDVFLAAPGAAIYTTGLKGSYLYIDGTSASSAVVAGVAAVMKAVDPTLTNGVISARLARSASAIGTEGDNAGNQDKFGNGRVNMAKALADTGTDSVQPAGASPVGDGGPYVGPYAAAATGDGSGKMAVFPPYVIRAAQDQSLNFTFTSTANLTSGAQVLMVFPLKAQWGAPQNTNSANANYVSAPTGSCTGLSTTIVNQNITFNATCSVGQTFSFTVSHIDIPNNNSASSFTVNSKNAGGAFVAIAVQPSVITVTNATSTLLQSTGTSSTTYGIPITFTATVTTGTTTPVTTGALTIYNGGTCSAPGPELATGIPNSSGQVVASPVTLNVGDYTIIVCYGGNTTYAASSDSISQPVLKAITTTTVTCGAGPFMYNTLAQTPCSASVTGAGGLNQTLTVNYTNNTSAGTASASATFAGDTNYAGSSDTKNFTINKANPMLTVTNPSVPYTGSGQAALVSSNVAGTVSNILIDGAGTQTNAGTYSVTASFASTDTNYNSVTNQATVNSFVIGQANTTTTVTCGAGPFTYTGAAQTPCSASVTGPGLDQTLTVNYTNNTNTGTASASATFAGDTNYIGSSDTKNFTINPATQTIDTITFLPITLSVGGTTNASASGGASGNSVIFTSLTTGVCTVSGINGATITGISAGTCTIAANQAGNSNYNAANQVTRNIVVASAASYSIISQAAFGGTITPAGTTSVAAFSSPSYHIAATQPGYQILNIVVDNWGLGYMTDFTFNNVTANHKIQATFTKMPYSTIAAGVDPSKPNGRINPSGQFRVINTTSTTFIFYPDAGYKVGLVTVDGITVTPTTANSYKFTGVTTGHTITVAFDPI